MSAVKTKGDAKRVWQKYRTNNNQSRKLQRCHKKGCGSCTISVKRTRKEQNAKKANSNRKILKKLNEMSAPKIRPEKTSVPKIR